MTIDEFKETIVGTPPEGWSLGHVTVVLSDSSRKPIEAWRRGAFAVHELECESHSARLTHAPTGLNIWNCQTMDEAAELAERIERLTDWNAISKMLPPGSDLYPKVREIADQLLANQLCDARE